MLPMIIFIKYKDFKCTVGLSENSISTFFNLKQHCRNLELDFTYGNSNFKLKDWRIYRTEIIFNLVQQHLKHDSEMSDANVGDFFRHSIAE